MNSEHRPDSRPPSDSRSALYKGLVLGGWTVATLLVFSAGLGYWNMLQLHQNDTRVAHTDEVLAAIEAVVSTMTDSETGQRGYLITGEDRYLAPYNAAVTAIQDRIQRLKRLTEDNPRQQARIREMEELISAALEGLDRTIALRKKNPEAARRIVLAGEGKKLMDAIRAQAQAIQQEEGDLLIIRQRQSRQSYLVAVLTTFFTLALGLGMIATLVWLGQRHLAERQKAETERAQAARSQARLAAIVESSDDAILSKDLNGIIQTWNAGADRLFGYRAEEVIGQSVTLLLPPERIQEESQILARMRSGRRVEHMETVRVAKDGRRLDISLTVSPIRDQSGRVIGASKIARDITERKRAESELKAGHGEPPRPPTSPRANSWPT